MILILTQLLLRDRIFRMEGMRTVLSSYKQVTVEPVVMLFSLNLGLTGITTQDLYLQKACRVNLNISRDICDNIHNHTGAQVTERSDERGGHCSTSLFIQVETQKFVSELQGYNGMLQAAPGLLFTLVAGPLTDTWGRRPLLLCSLLGHLLLSLILLVNAVWFLELRAEYLLFECLQDLTGGSVCFYLALYSYMADITSPGARSRRLSWLDSFTAIGSCIGLPLGTYIRNNYGFIAVFSAGGAIILVAMAYVILMVKESVVQDTRENDDLHQIKLDKGCIDVFSKSH